MSLCEKPAGLGEHLVVEDGMRILGRATVADRDRKCRGGRLGPDAASRGRDRTQHSQQVGRVSPVTDCLNPDRRRHRAEQLTAGPMASQCLRP